MAQPSDYPLSGKHKLPDFSKIDLDSLMGVNKKYGERTIDLAVEGWRFATNTGTDQTSIESGLNYAGRDKGLETRVEDIAYHEPLSKSTTTMRGVYQRGEGIKPNVPEEVIVEARDYLTRGRQAQIAFLREVYQQIVLGKDGSYAERFGKRESAAVLNYFADKLRGLGQTSAAQKMEARVREQFPGKKEKFINEYKKEFGVNPSKFTVS